MTAQTGSGLGIKSTRFPSTCLGQPEGTFGSMTDRRLETEFLVQAPGAAGDDLNLAALSALCPGRLPLAEFLEASEFRRVCGAAARATWWNRLQKSEPL